MGCSVSFQKVANCGQLVSLLELTYYIGEYVEGEKGVFCNFSVSCLCATPRPVDDY